MDYGNMCPMPNQISVDTEELTSLTLHKSELLANHADNQLLVSALDGQVEAARVALEQNARARGCSVAYEVGQKSVKAVCTVTNCALYKEQ